MRPCPRTLTPPALVLLGSTSAKSDPDSTECGGGPGHAQPATDTPGVLGLLEVLGKSRACTGGGESGCKRDATQGCKYGLLYVSRRPECTRIWGGCTTKARKSWAGCKVCSRQRSTQTVHRAAEARVPKGGVLESTSTTLRSKCRVTQRRAAQRRCTNYWSNSRVHYARTIWF